MVGDRFSLQGKVAMITGARSRNGCVLALCFAESGARLVLHGHRDDLGATIEAGGGTASHHWTADFSRPEEIGDALARGATSDRSFSRRLLRIM